MIEFLDIRFKNFFSSGDQFIEIDFTQSPTTLFVGKNGSGKSILLDAMTFVNFGKPFRKDVNKPMLVNSINKKDALVEQTFRRGSKYYMVRRGIKPNLFEIYEANSREALGTEGTLIDQAGSVGDYQAKYERDILQMDYLAFTQVVVLGKANYTAFMKLPLASRRKVIEYLLGLDIFATMNSVLKDRVKKLKEDILEIAMKVDSTKDKVDSRRQMIDRMDRERHDKIKGMQAEIVEINGDIEGLNAEVVEYTGQCELFMEKGFTDGGVRSLRKKKEEVVRMSAGFTSKMDILRKEIRFLKDNDNCPTCKQEIGQAFRAKTITLKSEKGISYKAAYEKLGGKVDALAEEISGAEDVLGSVRSLETKVLRCQSQVSGKQALISRLQREITGLESYDEEKEIAALRKLETELAAYETQKHELAESGAYYTAVGGMLKDSGIKAKIVQQYLPMFNTIINRFLLRMGFGIAFEFDEQFNETIKSRYRDKFSYGNFSEGQKLRIDLAILFAWREVAKAKNSLDTNVLIMDELFDSSLDQDGVDSFLEILPELEGTNFIVVSHTPDKLVDKFHTQKSFSLENNFTVMKDG